MRFTSNFNKHGFEEKIFSKKQDFECKIFSKKQDFERKSFRKKHDFELKNFRLFRFGINFFYNASVFELKILQIVRF